MFLFSQPASQPSIHIAQSHGPKASRLLIFHLFACPFAKIPDMKVMKKNLHQRAFGLSISILLIELP
ncbi:hypothetical protein L6452_16564 [Arctium lappa]|uniref:Uncharacterized protein n=1 Tax=Arctium lappa TaxID=4217 RepID=A0ACB9C0U0_ARCLA|nr:hypothetical protein L6452_16564 [Arctium lappa]